MSRRYAGTLVINGVSYPITEVRLRNNKIEFTGAVQTATRHLVYSGPVTVVGEDGQPICQGNDVPDPEEFKPGEHFRITYALGIDEIQPRKAEK